MIMSTIKDRNVNASKNAIGTDTGVGDYDYKEIEEEEEKFIEN